MITQLTSGTQSGTFCSTGSNVWFSPACCNKWWPYGHLGFPVSSVGKESACNAEDPGLIPGSGRSPGEGIGHPLQYSWASLVAQLVKNLPAVQETWVQSLGLDRSPEEVKGYPLQYPGLQNSMDYMGLQRIRHD